MAADTSADTELTWSLVLPVKVLARAKTRMAAAAGPLREALALAVAADTVAAALRCPAVAQVVVVTDDPVPAAELAALGARIVPDEPGGGLNPALAYGVELARRDRPQEGVAAMSADLPALRPAELAVALNAAARVPESFVPDALGVGTTLYATGPGVSFSPAFGKDSRDLHVSQGALELALKGIDSVRQDVDTPADLRAALALGVGPRTGSVAARLPALSDLADP